MDYFLSKTASNNNTKSGVFTGWTITGYNSSQINEEAIEFIPNIMIGINGDYRFSNRYLETNITYSYCCCQSTVYSFEPFENMVVGDQGLFTGNMGILFNNFGNGSWGIGLYGPGENALYSEIYNDINPNLAYNEIDLRTLNMPFTFVPILI